MSKIDVSLWQQKIQSCIGFQHKSTPIRKEIIKIYKSEFFGEPLRKTSNSYSEFNFLYEYMQVKTGSLYSRDPYIFCRARSGKWAAFAETMETIINYYWRELQLKRKFKSIIRESILIPPGWLWIGYKNEIQKNQSGAQLGEMDETVKQGNIFASYLPSFNVVWPDGYHAIRECPFLVVLQRVCIQDVISNPIYNSFKYKLRSIQYKKGGIRNLQPRTLKSDVPITSDNNYEDEDNKIMLFHVWDRRNNKRFTVAEGFYNDVLYESDWIYYIEGFPCYPLVFNEIPPTETESNSYPLSDVVPMLPQLRDLSILNAAMIRHGKRAGSIILVKKGTMTDTEITNISEARDIDIIPVETLSDEALRYFQTPALPSDWYRLRSIIIEDLMRISGFQQLLSQQRGVETATESENLRAGQMLRQIEAVDIIEDYTVDVARGIGGLAWQFLRMQDVEKIIGEPVSEEMWPMLPLDDDEAKGMIQAEIQFKIDAGSTSPPKDKAIENKMKLDAVAMIAATFPNRLKEDMIVKQVLKSIEFKDLENIVFTNDDDERKAAMQENQLLEQGIPAIASPNNVHKIHIPIHEQARNKTPELDNHILQHAGFWERTQPKANPQRGDTKRILSTTPELSRQGVPEFADLLASASNVTKGTGDNSANI